MNIPYFSVFIGHNKVSILYFVNNKVVLSGKKKVYLYCLKLCATTETYYLLNENRGMYEAPAVKLHL